MDQAEVLYRQGIKAIQQQQDLAEGQRLLRESLSINPRNDEAWVWLSQTTDDPARKLKCIENALKANPQNRKAIQLKQKMLNQTVELAATTQDMPVQNATNEKLGRLLLKVKNRRGLQIKRGIFVVVLTLGAVVFTIAGFEIKQVDTFWFVTGFGFGVFALVNLWLLISNRNQVIGIYDEGIVIIKGKQERIHRWHEFSALTLRDETFTYYHTGIPIHSQTNYNVKLLQADKVILDLSNEFQQFREMGELVMRLTAPIMTQQAIKDLKAGKTLEFGVLKVDRTGVKRGNKLITWRDLTEWNINNGWIKIYSNTLQTIRHNISRMKNPHVLMSLMDQLGRRGL